MPSVVDRARLKVYLSRLDYHLSDLPNSRIKEIRGDVRANTTSAAADIGMRQALANLGHPRVLAAGYLDAEIRSFPTYLRGVYWAGAALCIYLWTVMTYAFGFADGGAEADQAQRIATSFMGTPIEANGGDGYAVEFAFSAAGLLPALIGFLLGSRIWRALASARDRRAVRSS